MAGIYLREFTPGVYRRRRNVGPFESTITRYMNQSIIGARPDQIDVLRRRREGVNNTTARLRRHLRSTKHSDALRNFRLFTRKVRRDDGPIHSAIARLEENISGQVKDMWINWREHDRCGP